MSLGSFSWLLQWWTVARPVNLAQASRSRLGEMKQGDLCTKSRPGDSLTFWASWPLAQARGISLKRDPVMATPLFLCPRLGEGRLAWASHLAWARPLSLGEMLGETALCIGLLMLPVWSVLIGHDYVMMYMYIMEYETYVWHDSWLVGEWVGMRLSMRNKCVVWKSKEHGIDMRWDPRLIGWRWLVVWTQMWRVWGINLMDGYGIVNMLLIFSYYRIMNVGPCQRLIPWGL